MNLPRYALTHRSIVLLLVAILLVVGSLNFATMPRREDPEITIRDALVVTPWPGAPATRVDELITDLLEEAVMGIPELDTIESRSLVGASVLQLTASDDVADTQQVWDDVRAKVQSVRAQLPPGAAEPFVDSDFGDVYEILFALYRDPRSMSDRSYSMHDFERIAELIEERLERIEAVGRVELWGVQPERIYVEFDTSDMAQLGITANELASYFQGRNIVLPGGVLDTDSARFAVTPTGEFSNVSEIEDLIVGRVDGEVPVRLADLPVTISRRYEEPARSHVTLTTVAGEHMPAIVLGISMKSGRNVTDLDTEARAVVEELRGSAIPPDLVLERVNDLPRQVTTRIVDFQWNLVQGVLIVLGVALFAMGWRPALIMATAVPLSMISAFAVVRYFGIELEQFSIASLIIALGMVVDNAIVVSDNSVRLMREGRPRFDAVIEGAHGLAVPILTSTLTTVVAFLPMLTITGNAGEYIASLPIVVATTLGVSYLVAMLVTPIMCFWLLPDQPAGESPAGNASHWLGYYDRTIHWCLERPGRVTAMAGAALIGSLLLLPVVGSQFFPNGARDQFFIKVWLPEGMPIARTAAVTREVEAVLREASPGSHGEQRLVNAVSFIGSGGPRLMLTQEPELPYPYYALVLVNTTGADATTTLATEMREHFSGYPTARITVDEFMLGPPVKDPVAFRMAGPDRNVISALATRMRTIFDETPGVVDPYSNWGSAANQAELVIDTYAANLAGLTNADIAYGTSTVVSGAPLTNYREGDHLVPVLLRARPEKRESVSNLEDIYVSGQFGKVPLDSVADIDVTLAPSVIVRRNGFPTVTVGSRIEPGELANTVAGRVQPKLEALLDELPPGYRVEIDGELEETIATQSQVIAAVGISVLLMVLILTIQYNSLLKPAVVLAAIPLGLIGVVIGLLVTGWAMGFMAMLGILSLGGIVINNAIIMVDFIESNVAAGTPLRQAVAQAGRARMQPILLTTATTIGGLLPLSLFGGALWAPMTNGMIFGLIVSTALTLLVIPSLYVLLVDKAGMHVGAARA